MDRLTRERKKRVSGRRRKEVREGWGGRKGREVRRVKW